MTPEEKNHIIQIWEKTVDTQMHFSEMSVKSRQLGLTFVAAALGVAILMLGRGNDFSLVLDVHDYDIEIHFSFLLMLGALGAIFAVRKLDLDVYHRMLRGAVSFGEDFEKNYMSEIYDLEKGMTTAISHFSRNDDASVQFVNGKYKYFGGNEKSAYHKIKAFYTIIIWFLAISAATLLFVTNLSKNPGDQTTDASVASHTEDSDGK
jgi:hypothetical protein